MRRAVVDGAYVETLRMVWSIMCVLAGVMFMTSVIWIEELSLERELDTDQGFGTDSKATVVEDRHWRKPKSIDFVVLTLTICWRSLTLPS